MNGNQQYTDPRYLFHGEALGLAAHIQQPTEYFLDSVASSVLPITGGRAKAQAGPGGIGVISYQSASTQACGGFVKPADAARSTQSDYRENYLSTQTSVQAVVSGLKLDVPQEHSWFNLFGRSSRTVLAERLEAGLESTSDRFSSNAFKSLTAVFDGITVDGHALRVDTNTQLFTDNYTKKKLDDALGDERFRRTCSSQILNEWPDLTLATVVSRLRWEDGAAPHTEIEGNRLKIQGLGSLYFGEIVIQEGFRRLTLIRFQLGSADEGRTLAAGDERTQLQAEKLPLPPPSQPTGSGTIAQADSNGQTSPPQKGGN
jgi:hypothetical protein